MKKDLLKSSLLAGAVVLLSVWNMRAGGLKEIAKPYLGVYECTEAKWNEEDYLARFSYVQLELKEDGTFLLHYAETDGKRKTEKGRYTYDERKGLLTLSGGGLRRQFPIKDGVLTVHLVFGDKNLIMQFQQK